MLFPETVPNIGMEDMLDDFVTFFIAGEKLACEQALIFVVIKDVARAAKPRVTSRERSEPALVRNFTASLVNQRQSVDYSLPPIPKETDYSNITVAFSVKMILIYLHLSSSTSFVFSQLCGFLNFLWKQIWRFCSYKLFPRFLQQLRLPFPALVCNSLVFNTFCSVLQWLTFLKLFSCFYATVSRSPQFPAL